VFDGYLIRKKVHAMGEVDGSKLELEFNQSVKIEFLDYRITSNAGGLLLREADSRLGLTSSITSKMVDTRKHGATRYQLSDLLRDRVYAMQWASLLTMMWIDWHAMLHFELLYGIGRGMV